MEDELLTVPEAAAIMRVTRKAVYDMMRAGRLPYVQLGITRGRRIRRSALTAFLSNADRGVLPSQTASDPPVPSEYTPDTLTPSYAL